MQRFHLMEAKTYEDVFLADTLLEVWKHIKNFINEPRSYSVDELNNDNWVGNIGAYFLIENYKTEEDVPKTLWVDQIGEDIKSTAVAFKNWCDKNVITSNDFLIDVNAFNTINGRNLTNEQLYDEFLKTWQAK